jgi:endoglucanase
MSTARYGAAAAALTDGRVLVAGGIDDGSGNATASAEVYDSATDAWTPVAAMGSARAFAAAAPISGDRVLVAGGDVAGSPSPSAEIYDGLTGTWSAAAPMAQARSRANAVALPDGTVWVVGGVNGGASELYHPATNSWSDSMWTPSTAGAVAVPLSDGRVLIAGGFELDSSNLDPYWGVHSPTDAGTWPVTGLSLLSYMASAAVMPNGEVLMAGGSASASTPSGSTIALGFDAATQTWGGLAPMATARYGAVAAPLPDGRVLVAGGEGSSGPLASAEVFSPPIPYVPVNYSAPGIQDWVAPEPGAVHVGDVVVALPGQWNGMNDLGVRQSFDWQRCLMSSCADVSSGPTYPVTAADLGARLRVIVTLDDHGLTGTAMSPLSGVVAEPGFHLEDGTLQALIGELWDGRLSYLQLPVDRDTIIGSGQVSYRVWDPTASGYPAFPPATGVLTFLPGYATAMINVPMTTNGVPFLPAAVEVDLYGGSPLSVVAPAQERVDIRDPGSPMYVRDPANPLALPSAPPAGNPLAGASFFADYFQSLPSRLALAWSAADPASAAKVAVIAREPNVQRFGAWNGGYPGWNVASYLNRAASQEPGTVPMLSTYRLVYGHCGHWSDPPLEQAAYHDWITGIAQGIGTHPAVLFLEMDSLITVGCLSPQGVAVRMQELSDAINVLTNDPHLVTYLDAGAADALPARKTASLLRRAGVAKIQGFFLNSTHFDWTSKEIAYGEKVSRLTGGKHFVINTAENGQGPLRPHNVAKQGNEVLCDPPGRGLGPLPTSNTGHPNVDAFAWIANPGVSGGQCRPGAPPSGVFWPALALQLVHHEDFQVR